MTAPLLPDAQGSIALRSVSRSFGKRKVLDGLNWNLEGGVVAAVLGDNGSGKSTLLRVLAGLLNVDAGVVLICDQPAGSRRATFVPAGDRGLHWRLTGRQNFAFIGRVQGLDRGSRDQAICAAAEMVGATDFLDEPVRICSTGQRRRLLLGQALLGGCPVLLLDEPFADLDSEGVDCVRRISQLWALSGGLVLAAGPSVDAVPEPSATLVLGAAS